MPQIKSKEALKSFLLTSRLLSVSDWNSAAALFPDSASVELVLQTLERKQLLTPFQVGRIQKGETEGLVLGRYKLLYRNASGSFARVFRAESTTDNSIVALKLLRERWVDDPRTVASFEREARICQRFIHPNIVPILDIGSEGRFHYFTMEFIEGGNLRDFMKIRKTLSPLEATRVIYQICLGLEYALKMGASHRDLKLTNVLMSSTGVAKLVDFGLAGAENATQAGTSDDVQRALEYSTLERGTNAPRNDPRSDIFFAGSIYYELLCGEGPWARTTDREEKLLLTRYSNVRPLKQVLPGLPEGIYRVLKTMMELNPSARYQSCTEVINDLRPLLVELGDTVEDTGRSNNSRAAQATSGKVTGAATAKASKKSFNLLVVEPGRKREKKLKQYFEQYSFALNFLEDATAAFEKLKGKTPPDGLLFMADVDSGPVKEIYSKVQAYARTLKVPCVALFAAEEEETVKKQIYSTKFGATMFQPTSPRDLRQHFADVAGFDCGPAAPAEASKSKETPVAKSAAVPSKPAKAPEPDFDSDIFVDEPAPEARKKSTAEQKPAGDKGKSVPKESAAAAPTNEAPREKSARSKTTAETAPDVPAPVAEAPAAKAPAPPMNAAQKAAAIRAAQRAAEREAQEKAAAEKAAAERAIIEQAEREAQEKAAREKAELDRIAAEKAAAEEAARKKIEDEERAAREKIEAKRRAKEEAARKAEEERIAREKAEAERKAAEEAARKAEEERIARLRAEEDRRIAEEAARIKAEEERIAAERAAAAERAKAEIERAEKEMAEKFAAARRALEEQHAAALAAAEKAQIERLAAEKLAAEKLAAERAIADRERAEREAAEKIAAAERAQKEADAAARELSDRIARAERVANGLEPEIDVTSEASEEDRLLAEIEAEEKAKAAARAQAEEDQILAELEAEEKAKAELKAAEKSAATAIPATPVEVTTPVDATEQIEKKSEAAESSTSNAEISVQEKPESVTQPQTPPQSQHSPSKADKKGGKKKGSKGEKAPEPQAKAQSAPATAQKSAAPQPAASQPEPVKAEVSKSEASSQPETKPQTVKADTPAVKAEPKSKETVAEKTSGKEKNLAPETSATPAAKSSAGKLIVIGGLIVAVVGAVVWFALFQ